MTDSELVSYLQENGYPEHIWRGGRAGLVARWKQFVSEVENGYELGLEDYRNELDVRGLISLAGLDANVQQADTRFEALLTARDKRVWESSASDPFWDFGYPSNASGDLLADLKAEELA